MPAQKLDQAIGVTNSRSAFDPPGNEGYPRSAVWRGLHRGLHTGRSGSWARWCAALALGALAATPLGYSAAARADDTAPAAPAAPAAAPADTGLPEITVTAEKVRSTVQDTPISVTALDGDALQTAGITSIEEIAHEVPGLSMRSAGPGLTEYEARGLASNGGAAPTVGFYLDEIPLSPPALSQSGKVVIDPNLYDVSRVEVLRGPQGTLYGSGSMGGTVKIITNAPKLKTWEGSAQGMLSTTDGGGTNGSANAAFNIPIGDMFALRVVGSDTHRSGWIDEVAVNPFPVNVSSTHFGSLTSAPVESVIHDANDENLSTERISLLFQPSEAVSVTAFFMNQRLSMGGYDLLDSTPTSSTSPGPVYDAHYEPFSMREPIQDNIQITSLTAEIDLGFADLTSATSYWDRQAVQTQDASTSIYWTNAQAGGHYPPLVPIPYSEVDPSRQFAQEIRLASHDVGGLHWVGGAYFSALRSVWQEESANPIMQNFGIPSGSYFTSYNPYDMRQSALFADGSYALDSHWKIAAGLRWYSYHSGQHEQSWGYDAPFAVPSTPTLTTADEKGTNPRFNVSYEPDKTLTYYATAAKGFRPGGANQIIPPPNLPPHCTPGSLSFKPDSVWNYEVGEKAKLLDNRLTINGDLYYIKWSGVQQVFTLVCGYQYYNNAGDGRSYGPELEINAKLTQHLTASVSGTYTNSEITNPTQAYQQYLSQQVTEPNGSHPCPVSGSCTAPIMNIPKETGSAVLSYTQEVATDYVLTGRLDASFVGTSTDLAYYYGMTLPSYTITNFRMILERDKWSGQFFIDNLTNKVALMTANNTSFQFNIPQVVRYSTNQPRTVGVSFNYRF
jgi:outer membrane receptor protein involved in Fe transport